MKKLIIGLTGGIGSGKTTITNMFAEKNIDVIDADIIAREVVAPNSEALLAIKENFGTAMIQKNGQLNRALLRSKVFSDDRDKRWLNSLLHPLIRKQIIAQTHAAKSAYCLLVAPLLIENNLLSLVDRVLVIDVCEATQLKRTLTRDKTSSKEEIQSIIASQISRIERLKVADDIIDNNSYQLTQAEERVVQLHQEYLTLSTTL
jgi:dephospho-CoA kinase